MSYEAWREDVVVTMIGERGDVLIRPIIDQDGASYMINGRTWARAWRKAVDRFVWRWIATRVCLFLSDAIDTPDFGLRLRLELLVANADYAGTLGGCFDE